MQINNLKVKRETYRGSRIIFDNLNLKTKARINVIFGPPGTGKSTLLEVIAGVLEPVQGKAEGFNSKNHQFLMQVPERQFIYGSCRAELEKKCKNPREALTRFGLPEDIMELSPWSLSKGQRKKLLLAGFITGKSGNENFILDDPFKDLDKKGINLVVEEFFRPRANKVIMATASRRELQYLKTKGIKSDIINIKAIKNRKYKNELA
ncbi:MAG: ABC transporter ATP-binding protein [Elusimicrobiota bacterium]